MGKKKKDAKKSGRAQAAAAPVRKKLKIDPGKPAQVLSSRVAYDGKLFRVIAEEIREAKGKEALREVVRHGGSTVILAVDGRKSRKNPLVLIERQYRHAAQQYLYEIPAGKLEPNEDRLAGAKRELAEETGYTAKKWTKLAKYYPSPGFLGEWMQVFLAEDLTPGATSPDEDEWLELQMVPLKEVLRLIDEQKIQDGKTIIAALSYARRLGKK